MKNNNLIASLDELFEDISIYNLDNGGGFTLTTGELITINNITKITPKIITECGPNGKEINKEIIEKALKTMGGVH